MDPVTVENALETKCKNYAWLTWVLFLTASPVIFNNPHLTSYVFLGGEPSFFCNVRELVEANWTKEDIRRISSPGSNEHGCVQYAWNYSIFKKMDFNEALSYFNNTPKPNVVKCKSYIYEEEVHHQTVVSEWDLVCDDSSLASAIEGAVAIGKLSGAVTFGLFSDRFGRKKIYVFSWLLYAISATSAAFVNGPVLYLVLRLLTGIAGAGVLDAGYTILLEITVKHYRACVGNIFNLSFSIGLVYLALMAYLTNSWRQLQLAISAPLFLLIINCWFLPESPRWLITSGNYEKAAKIMGTEYKIDFNHAPHSPPGNPKSVSDKIVIFWKAFYELFSTFEFVKRLIIFSYAWFMGNLYYFSIALNGSNIGANQYIYVGLNGIIEMPGYLSPILFLRFFGRKTTGITLWSVAGATLLATMVIPKGWPILVVSLFGRLVGTGAYGAVMLHASEVFPTKHRNFAIGTCLTVAQLGPLLAPYIVEVLGRKAWWLPTTMCGSLAILCALLLTLVPETRNTPMPDTIKEMNLAK